MQELSIVPVLSCPVLSSSPACIVLVFIRPVAYSRYRSRGASETPRARLLACASPGLLARVSSSTTGKPNNPHHHDFANSSDPAATAPKPSITRHRDFACTFHRQLREAGTARRSDVHISPLHPVLSQSSSATPFCMQAALHQRQAPWLQRKRQPSSVDHQRLSLLRLLLAGCLIPPADPD